MPIHDYRCGGCGQQFELLLRHGTVPTCPHCGGQALERQISCIAPAVTTPSIVAGARRAAARDGHFSHYARAERAKLAR